MEDRHTVQPRGASKQDADPWARHVLLGTSQVENKRTASHRQLWGK